MTGAVIAGIIVGLIATWRLPLPKWRLLAGLIPLGMLIAGLDSAIMLSLPHYATSSSIAWLRFGSGLLIGCGAGYFVRWIRIELASWTNTPRK